MYNIHLILLGQQKLEMQKLFQQMCVHKLFVNQLSNSSCARELVVEIFQEFKSEEQFFCF